MLSGWIFFGITSFAVGFTPTEVQRTLLKEGIESVKELKERYTNLTMKGTTDYFHADKPRGQQRFTMHFRFVRMGNEYCLLEAQTPNLEVEQGKTEMLHVCRLIGPNASYQFLAQSQGEPPTFTLGEKTSINDKDNLSQEIDILVFSNWRTGSAPYGGHKELSFPFDMTTARRDFPIRGGYIKEMQEKIVNGERVVTLKMGYYFNHQEASGVISYYPDYYWAVKDSSFEGVNAETGEISNITKINNVYDFSEAFPKLLKTTIETLDTNGDLIDSQVSTITSIDFTVPDMTEFDPNRYVGGATDALPTVQPRQRLSPFQIAGIIIGLLLIAWGLGLRFWTPKKHENEQ